MTMFLVVATVSACDSAESTLDAGAPDQRQPDPTASATNRPTPPADPALPTQTVPGCASQLLDSGLTPVHGTVHGPKVDGDVCDNGVGTYFLNSDTGQLAPYVQQFFTTTVYSGAVPNGSPGTYGFALSAPAAALSGDLSGLVGAQTATVGTHDSATNCGWLEFVVTVPGPPGVACEAKFAPCDPGCEASGEAFVCVPARTTAGMSYGAATDCAAARGPRAGSWQLTVTSVAPLEAPQGYRQFETHGHLTATLVNRADATDSIELNLDF